MVLHTLKKLGKFFTFVCTILLIGGLIQLKGGSLLESRLGEPIKIKISNNAEYLENLGVDNVLYVDTMRVLTSKGLKIKLGENDSFSILKKQNDGTNMAPFMVDAHANVVVGNLTLTGTSNLLSSSTFNPLILPGTLSVSGSTALSSATVTGSIVQGSGDTTKIIGNKHLPLALIHGPAKELFTVNFVDATGSAFVSFNVVGKILGGDQFVYRANYFVTPSGITRLTDETFVSSISGTTPGNTVATTTSASSGFSTTLEFSFSTLELTGPMGVQGPLVFYEVMGYNIASVTT